MSGRIHRRSLLARAAGSALAGSLVTRAVRGVAPASAPGTRTGAEPKLRRALIYSTLPASLSAGDRFALAAELGFEGIEVSAAEADEQLDELRAASRKTGLPIHSVMDAASWEFPLSSGDASVAGEGLRRLRLALRHGRELGANAVLLVPAVVTPEVRYEEAWQRSQERIRTVLPLAGELGVTIAIENVGNRFLLSPIEFARYVDAFHHPCLRAYFDIGNSLMLWGYPQDWIRTLGPRIRKLHLKDCDFQKKRFVPPGDGDVDWPAVLRAIRETGYAGWITFEPNYRLPEDESGRVKHLRDVARRIDEILGKD